MATDSGLVYLSGLLRAGAEPLGPVGHAPRRGGAAAPRTIKIPQASSSYSPAPSERFGVDEPPHSLERDAPERETHATASQTNADDASTVHNVSADSGETTFAKQPESFGVSHIAPLNVTLEENVAESAASVAPSSHASRRARVSPTPSSNTETDIENQPREKDAGHVPPSLTTDMHSTAGDYESTTPLASRVTGAFREEEMLNRPHSEEEIWTGETEHAAFVTEHVAVASSEGEPSSETPRLLNVTWSSAPPQEEAINSVASTVEVARGFEDAAATHAVDMTKTDAAPIVHGTSPVRGLATRHEQHVFDAPPEERRRRRESNLAPTVESAVTRGEAGARGIADSTTYTLEAHIEQLRALMQTSRVDSSGGMGESTAVPAQSAADTAKETRARVDALRRTRESTRGEPRNEFAARPPAVLSKSDSRQSVVIESSNQPGATTSRRTSAKELAGDAPVALRQKTGAGAATNVQERNSPHGRLSPSRPAGSPADTPARIGVAQPREVGTQGGIKASSARTPKLTINRLDVQVVERANPSPTVRPATPAPAPPSQPDPWGAQDRHFLGRFFY